MDFNILTVKAKFTGMDGSLGYRNGTVYNLRFWILPKNKICISLGFNNGVCEYSSLKKFLDNWKVIN